MFFSISEFLFSIRRTDFRENRDVNFNEVDAYSYHPLCITMFRFRENIFPNHLLWSRVLFSERVMNYV